MSDASKYTDGNGKLRYVRDDTLVFPGATGVAPGPQFEVGDRCFSHYVMSWGTVERIGRTTEPTVHGVTGSPLPGSTWYTVRMDKSGQMELLDDAHGNWELARIVPARVAERYGYGSDPQPKGER